MKIYTKKGDAGYTKLGTGDAIPKSDPAVEAYGTVDELSSFLGLAASDLQNQSLIDEIIWVQRKLFAVGSILAFPRRVESAGLEELGEADVVTLEQFIDRISGQISPLQDFILPGGGREAALLHCARSVCRRAERLVSRLEQENYPLGVNILPFLNRLSDYLFSAARFANHLAGRKEHLAKSEDA